MKNQSNEELEKALSFDSLDYAEKITGIEYKQDESTTALGMILGMANGQVKKQLLAKNHDTDSWHQSLEKWIATVIDIGFRLVLEQAIENPEYPGDKFRMFWNPGLLLTCDSYWGDKSVNSAKCYFNFKGPRNAMFSCSNGHIGEIDGVDVWGGDFDAREGMRFRLDKMKSEGELLQTWIKQPFLWLLHYGDIKIAGYDYELINTQRMEKLPLDVRMAIGVVKR